jgi:hypothetical protein
MFAKAQPDTTDRSAFVQIMPDGEVSLDFRE